VLVRPVQNRPPGTAVVLLIGLFILLDGLVTWRWGGDIQYLPAPFGNAVYHIGTVAFSLQSLGTFGVSIAAVVALWLFFRFTKLGFGMRGISERREVAELVGIPVNRMLAIGWGLAAVLGAVAGLMAEPTQVLQPTMMHSILIYALAAAVLGGFDSPSGAVIGGLMLGVFLNLAGAYIHFVTPELRLPAAFAVLIGVLLLKPNGLLGSQQVQRA
jgi:branched-chain amino acid transport system permease protein